MEDAARGVLVRFECATLYNYDYFGGRTRGNLAVPNAMLSMGISRKSCTSCTLSTSYASYISYHTYHSLIHTYIHNWFLPFRTQDWVDLHRHLEAHRKAPQRRDHCGVRLPCGFTFLVHWLKSGSEPERDFGVWMSLVDCL